MILITFSPNTESQAPSSELIIQITISIPHIKKTKSNRRVRSFREQYLENGLHVIGNSGKPVVALFGGGGSRNSIGRRNGGIGNRVKKSLRSAKQFSENTFSFVRLGQETGLEPEAGDGKRTAKKVSGGRTGESVGVRSVREVARAPVPQGSRDYVRRAR